MASKNKQTRSDQPKWNPNSNKLHTQGPKIDSGIGKRQKSTKND